jgi:hypothetical protein
MADWSHRYDVGWKRTCLRLLEIYRESLERTMTRKVIGWGMIRDEIMKPYDDYDEAGRLRERSALLSRQNVESWFKDGPDGSKIGDDKFRFVDEFIRRLSATEDGRGLNDVVIHENHRVACDRLSRLYQPRNLRPDLADIIQNNLGDVLISEDLSAVYRNARYRYIAMKFDGKASNSLFGRVSFIDTEIDNDVDRVIGSSRTYNFYLVPIKTEFFSSEWNDDSSSINLTLDEIGRAIESKFSYPGDHIFYVHCALKLVENGDHAHSVARADAEAIVEIDIIDSHNRKNNGISLVSPISLFNLDYPNIFTEEYLDLCGSNGWINRPRHSPVEEFNPINKSDFFIDIRESNVIKENLEALFRKFHKGILP